MEENHLQVNITNNYLELNSELTTFGFLEKIVMDPKFINKVVRGLPEVIYYDHDRSVKNYTY